MIKERNLIGLAIIAVLAACGGGGGGGASVPGSASATSPPGPAATPTLAAAQGLVHFSITVPATVPASSSKSVMNRRAQYVDPNTVSITLTLLENNNITSGNGIGGVQGPFNLVAGATGCSASAPLVCTFSISAPVGNDVFLATTYSAPNAQGPLGSGAVALSVLENATNTASLTLTGPIQSIAAVSTNEANLDTLWNGAGTFFPLTAAQVAAANYDTASPPPVTATAIPSERVYLVASDVAGNVILNPTTYNQPIVLTLLLNGGPANVTLTDAPPAGLTCGGNTTTSVNLGTVNVCSPSDAVTLTLIGTVPSPQVTTYPYTMIDANFPSLTASLAAPPAGFSPVTFPFTVEVGPGGSLPVIVQ